MNVDQRLQKAVQSYWSTRAAGRAKQKAQGKTDTDGRGEAVGGQQMAAMEKLIADVLVDVGVPRAAIRTRSELELPGYFRATKKWDLVVVSNGQLLAAMEFKSQAGKSIGNNVNNRTEEAVGSAQDIWTAFREGRIGAAAPFLGYVFLLEEQEKIGRPVSNKEPHFPVDPVFRGETNGKRFLGVSYRERYEVLCRRLVRERLYNAACFLTATNARKTVISQPAEDLTFARFVGQLRGHVAGLIG